MEFEKENEIFENDVYNVAEIVHSYENRIYKRLTHEIFGLIDCLEFIKRQKPDLEELIDSYVGGVNNILKFYDYAKMDFNELSDNQKRQHYYKVIYGNYNRLF